MSEQRSAADRLLDLAERDWRLHVDEHGDVFAVPVAGLQHIARRLRGGRLGLRQALAAAYHREHGKVAPQQALADALTTLEGMAQDSDAVPLHLRVAEHDGALWIDLGDAEGHVVRVKPGGWKVKRRAPVLFTRTELAAPLPMPERGGDLEALWEHLNVPAEDRSLLLAVLVAAFVPNIPHPVLDLEGEQGSGKSTLAKRLVDLLDPSPVPMRKAPRDPEAFVTAAGGSWVVSLDNLSTLPEWLSDSLCRASTGEGDVRRRLYSDGDLSVFAYRRVVIVNGIDLAGIRGDLAERLVTVRPPRFDAGRRGERELDAAWQAARPALLGALLDLLSEVWGEVSEVSEQGARAISGRRFPSSSSLDQGASEQRARRGEPEKARAHGSLTSLTSPSSMRMADFARIVAAVDRVLGTNGLDRYAERNAETAAETLTASPFVSRLLTGLRAPFNGTAEQLRAMLTATTATPLPRNWPSSAKAVTGELRRHGPALRQQGWGVTDEEDRKRHRTIWHLVPPTLGEAPGYIRCLVADCGNALTSKQQRTDGVCGKHDPEHDTAREVQAAIPTTERTHR